MNADRIRHKPLGPAETELSAILFQIRLARRKRLGAVMYSVCGDESHDAKRERVFAIGGLFGSQEDFDAAEALWVATTKGKVFHAADCESDQGEFEGIPHQENLALYKNLTQILVNSKLCARGVGIDLAASHEYFPDILPESDYHKCLMEILIYFGELASISIPQQKVKFTFDQRFETDYSAAQLYHYLTNQPDWKLFPYYHDAIEFATRRSPGIQMADLIARETMKELDRRVSGSERQIRKSMGAMVAKPYRFEFTYFMREYFQDFRNKFTDVVVPSAKMDFSDFASWLRKTGVTDSWSARLKYVTYLESEERLRKAKEQGCEVAS
jgi:hypothetical protein